MAFDISKYIQFSKAVDTSDLDWHRVREFPLTDEEKRIIAFFASIEAYTVIYLRDLLNTNLVEDAEVAAFLPCWAYEEGYHGRAFYRFLSEAQAEGAPPILPLPIQRAGFKEMLDALGGRALGAITPHFTAVHLTWGAVNELTAITSYERLMATTQHPILKELLQRINKDERRHYAFYYNHAEKRLQHPTARAITRWVMTNVWQPVGYGIGAASELETTARVLFADEAGQQAAIEIDEKISKLPGLEGLKLVSTAIERVRTMKGRGAVNGLGAIRKLTRFTQAQA